ncbi:MAG: DEAD/DEAH box helicase [Nanobdellota archaeon]
MIKDFKPRLYQETIFANACIQNCLIVLPTGLGKTNIFLMISAHRLKQYPKSKIVLLGPTRPLIEQYKNVFEKHFNINPEDMVVLTGLISPEKRKDLWDKHKIIFSTPQGLENDIISNRISLKDVSLLGFDEAHRAVGDYSYVYIAKKYQQDARYARIIALTASPGSEKEKIEEVVNNLHIQDIQIRSDQDNDVKEYIKDIKVSWERVELPQDFKRVQEYLINCLKSKIKSIEELGLANNINKNSPSRKELLTLQASLQGELAQGNKEYSVLKSLSLAAEAMKVQHAIELLETQSTRALNLYIEDINKQSKTTKTKAVQNLVIDTNFRAACVLTRKLIEKDIEHPKLKRLKELLEKSIKKEDYKVICFTQFRDTASLVAEELNKCKNIKAKIFIGQSKKRNSGFTQKEQITILEEFKNNKFNVLVSSSVGEEGLDVPQVDEVIFYEPIPSAIRHIQRRGRTGRQDKGNMKVLLTKGTRDEIYKWSAFHKEKKMYSALEKVKNELVFKRYEKKPQPAKEMNKEITVFADHREKGNRVIKELDSMGVYLRLEKLDYGDYLLGNQCCVEFKTVEDFVDSLIDGRLLEQVKQLKSHYEKPILFVEGTQDIFSVRNVHPNAIRGIIATITVSFGVPILITKTPKETSQMFLAIAKREQENIEKDFALHSQKPATTKEMQEYLVSALPSVGPSLAKGLLKHFKNVENIINASEKELTSVERIGKKKANLIRKVIEKDYG